MENNFLNMLTRNPRGWGNGPAQQDIPEAIFDEWGNPYTAQGQRIPQQQGSLGNTLLGVAEAPARMTMGLLDSLSPYGSEGARVPPLAQDIWETINAPGTILNDGMTKEDMGRTATNAAGFMMGGGLVAPKPSAVRPNARLSSVPADELASWETGWPVAASYGKRDQFGQLREFESYLPPTDIMMREMRNAGDIDFSFRPRADNERLPLRGSEDIARLNALGRRVHDRDGELFSNGSKGGAGVGVGVVEGAKPIRAYHGTDGPMTGKSFDGPSFWANETPSVASKYAEGLHRGSSFEATAPNMLPVDMIGSVYDATGLPNATGLFDVARQNAREAGADIIKYIGGNYEAINRGSVKSPLTGETIFSNGSKPGAAIGAGVVEGGSKRMPVVLSGGPGEFVANEASRLGLLANQAVDHVANLANIPAHYLDGRAMGASIPSAASDTFNTLRSSKNALNAEYAQQRSALEQGGKTPFSYTMESPEGDFLGSANGSVVGDTMYLDWLGGNTPNSLGVSGVKSLRNQVRSDFPEVKKFQGMRVSGARDRANATDRMQEVTLLSNGSKGGAAIGNSLVESQQGIEDILQRYYGTPWPYAN